MAYRLLDHTADFMVQVRAPTLAGLFEEAARALGAALVEPGTVEPRERRAVELNREALDPVELLVSFLNELLFLYESESWLFCRVRVDRLDDRSVRAEVVGEPLDPARHAMEREVKAVTYHRLGIKELDGQYETTIVFDL